MTKEQYQELASELYERTIDFLNEETIEMLYDLKIIQDTDDDAMRIANKVMHEFYNKQLTKSW